MRVSWKANQLTPTFDYTVTILNKLSAKDSTTKRDVWYPVVLHNCSFTGATIRDVQGTTVSVGNAFTCRIPKNEKYRPYKEWKSNTDDYFTLNVGDYVFLGELDDSEIVTPETIQTIYQSHKDTAFCIRAFKDNTGVIESLEHYRVDGVAHSAGVV